MGKDEDKKEKRKRMKVKEIIKQNCCCSKSFLHLITRVGKALRHGVDAVTFKKQE
jgi:hypothetical protein